MTTRLAPAVGKPPARAASADSKLALDTAVWQASATQATTLADADQARTVSQTAAAKTVKEGLAVVGQRSFVRTFVHWFLWAVGGVVHRRLRSARTADVEVTWAESTIRPRG